MNETDKISKIAIYWEQNDWGGVDSYIKNFVSSKVFSNFKFTIFTNKDNKGCKRILNFLKSKEIEVVYFNSFNNIYSKLLLLNLLINLLKPIFFFFSLFQSYFLLRKYNFDILLAQCGGFGNFRSEVAAILSSKFLNFSKRYLVVHHSCSKPIFWNTLLNIINNLLSKSLTAVISVSKATRDSIFYKSNLFDSNSNLKNVVIYNGIDIKEIKKTENLNIIFHKSNDYYLNLGVVSRIETYKGHLDLIDAFDLLPKIYKERIKIFFIGMGSEKEVLFLNKKIYEKNLSKYFTFTGYLDYESSSIISYLDLLISPTRTFEGFGISIVEATLVGIPVVATRVGAIPEYLDNNCSRIIEAGDLIELKNSLIDFVDNRNDWKNKALKAKDKIINNFTVEIMSKKYLEYFLS